MDEAARARLVDEALRVFFAAYGPGSSIFELGGPG